MASLRVALLLATTQTARAKSATLAAVASNADYVNRLYGSSKFNAVDPSKLRVVFPSDDDDEAGAFCFIVS